MEITKEDVFGSFADSGERVKSGMIVAQGYHRLIEESKKTITDICPVWKDKLPNKSVTVICDNIQIPEVKHWLEYVHGGPSHKAKLLEGGRVAIRSDYQCW